MSLIEFKDLPDTTTPITAENLNNNFNELKSELEGTILYTGSTNTNFILTDDYTNYDYIEIYGKKSSTFGYTKFQPSQGDRASMIISIPNGSVVTFYNTNLLFNETSVTLGGVSIAFNSSGIPGYANTVETNITKVIGYKL